MALQPMLRATAGESLKAPRSANERLELCQRIGVFAASVLYSSPSLPTRVIGERLI